MVPCRNCKLFHPPMVCGVAKAQLKAGTLAEPYLTANRLELLLEKKAEAVHVADASFSTTGVIRRVVKGKSPAPALAPSRKGGRPKVYADAKARRQEYMREYMRKRRAKV